MKFNKLTISVFLAILLHVCGAFGILFTPYRYWFVAHTPINLLLMTFLLIWNQSSTNKAFFIFAFICFFTGMLTEIIGVNTGLLFGNYSYGNVMGLKLMGVPLLIGVNWFVLVYCCIILMEKLHSQLIKKYHELDTEPPKKLMNLSLVIDAALLATAFDWLMEPVAVKLNFWQWESMYIPLFNYFCWFIIACFLINIARKLSFNKINAFAIHLLIIQTLFFLTLSIFL